MPDSNTRKHRSTVLQMEYNAKRHGEPDNWMWQDAGIALKQTGTPEEIEQEARAFIERSGESKFIRGYRLVDRVTLITDTVLTDLAEVKE